jgi:tetratricopeptide (TPR) repeat protein
MSTWVEPSGAAGDVDFFVSYTGADRQWAEWISQVLEVAGYRVRVQAWDLVPGTDWPALIQAGLTGGARLLAVLSPAYLQSVGAAAEWQAVWAADMDGRRRRLIPVLVEPCEPAALGLIATRSWIDLTGLAGPGDDEAARARLLDGVAAAAQGRVLPAGPLTLPTRGAAVDVVAAEVGGGIRFPGRVPAVWGVPDELPRNPRFVGREAEFAGLREGLTLAGRAAVVADGPTSHSQPSWVGAQAMYGWGGVGKTELALEYAYRYRGEYDVVWWIRAERPALVVASLARLAAGLGLAGSAVGGNAAAAAAVEALRVGQPYDRWLVVVDNAVDPSDLLGLLQAAENCEQGHLLVTSRNPEWAGRARAVEVAVLPRSDSIALLRAHCPGLSGTEAGRLAEELGDLPLAVEQAGAWLAAGGMSVPDYLAALRAETRELLARGVPDRYRAVAAAWNLALERIGPDEPAVADLLHLAGFFGPEPIPLELFQFLPGLAYEPGQPPGPSQDAAATGRSGSQPLLAALAEVSASRLRFHDTVARVRALGLGKVEDGTLTLHRLTQSVLRDHLPPERRAGLEATAVRLLAAVLPDEIAGHPAGWPAWARLLPHVLALIHTHGAPDGQLLGLADGAARYLAERGQLHPAIGLFERTLADRIRLLGPKHPDTLTSQLNLARAYEAAGRPAEAVVLFEQTRTGRTGVLGADHPDTLAAQHSLAGAYQQAGRADEAIALYRQTVLDRTRALGEDHPDTLGSQGNLAHAYLSAGRLAEAIALYERTLDGQTRVLGADHPDTLAARGNLARAYQQAGRADDAIALFERTLDGQTRVLGVDHPDTLASRANLAGAYLSGGRTDEAITLHGQALADCERILGGEHPFTLAARANLAGAYRQVGRVDEAITLFERTLADCERILGGEHPFTLAARANLADAYRQVGRVDEAIVLLERTLSDRSRLLGDAHPATLSVRVRLAGAHRQAGRADEAITLYEQARTDVERVWGADHPSMSVIIGNLTRLRRDATPGDADSPPSPT